AVFLASLKQFVVWRQALLYFSLTVSMYGFQLWLPQIIKSFDHVDDSTTALLSAIPALFQALGMIIIAGNSDRIAERKFHVAAAAILTCFGLALAAFGPGSVLKMAGLCLAAFGIWGSVGPEHHSSGIAFINSVGNLGGFAGPYIVGAITQVSGGGDFAGALLALCFASVLACGLAVTSRT
ncbi:MAG TPA: MFS transporter, partial [Candidatus Melainabacteria bacterium]|nr:MFS transporter [Candidatus Melainabacteria bacterium]